MSKNVQSFFDEYSKDFSDLSSSIAIYERSKNFKLSTLINRIIRNSMISRFGITINAIVNNKCTSVLDIGCGPGEYAISLREHGLKNIQAIDFSQKMIDTAEIHEKEIFGTTEINWQVLDFLEVTAEKQYDGVIVVGVMDYIEDPKEFIDAVFNVTGKVAVISFPVNGGFMAWQRKIRYKRRCYLRMYSRNNVLSIFNALDCKTEIIDLGRDLLVIIKKY